MKIVFSMEEENSLQVRFCFVGSTLGVSARGLFFFYFFCVVLCCIYGHSYLLEFNVTWSLFWVYLLCRYKVTCSAVVEYSPGFDKNQFIVPFGSELLAPDAQKQRLT